VCTVCLDEYEEGDEIRELECEHAFHKKCIDEWLTTKRACCPCCKHSLVPAPAAQVPIAAAGTAEVQGSRRRRRRRSRTRAGGRAGGGTPLGDVAESGDAGDDGEYGEVEASGDPQTRGDDSAAEDVRSADSTTVPLLARTGRGDDAESGGGVFGWASLLAGGRRASAAGQPRDEDSAGDSDALSEVSESESPSPIYVAPRAVDVETGGE
jgi:hypothetical protein